MIPNRKDVKALARSVTFNKSQICNNFIISLIFQAIPYAIIITIPVVAPRLFPAYKKDNLVTFAIVLLLTGLVALAAELMKITPLFVGSLHIDYNSQEVSLGQAFQNTSKFVKLVIGIGTVKFISWVIKLIVYFILSRLLGTGLSVPFMILGTVLTFVISLKLKFMYTCMAYNNSLNLLGACIASWNTTNLRVIWEIIKLDITFIPYYALVFLIGYIPNLIAKSFPMIVLLLFIIGMYIITATYGMYRCMVMLIYWDNLSNNRINTPTNNTYANEYCDNNINNYM